ncbi:hypothetical protein [Methylobacterium marchantiae]|uniref:NadR/Ttd14 AAA domain-containing protein n=1 Tax=Methylobacterium marchantiae TaxID=600331 RepID=A0ABW3X2X8_9HYPH|nr:hypothetical protein AIGOOFII_3502 [Methylobacterium marchantiae]
MLDLKVINIWAAPGVGKSTTAAGLYYHMKQLGCSVELVTEFAKDLTWERNMTGLQNQLAILGEQDHRLRRLEGKVEFAITDSPLPLGIAYLTPEYDEMGLDDAILNAYGRYRNFDYLLARVKPYRTEGRNQTQHEALVLDATVMDLFRETTDWDGSEADYDSAAFYFPADEWAVSRIALTLPLHADAEKSLAA